MKTATRAPRLRTIGYQAAFFHPLTMSEAEMEAEACRRAADAGFTARRVVATETHTFGYHGAFVSTITVLTLEVSSADDEQPRSESPTHCPWGHAYTPENIYIQPNRGTRACRKCRQERMCAHAERIKHGSWELDEIEPNGNGHA